LRVRFRENDDSIFFKNDSIRFPFFLKVFSLRHLRGLPQPFELVDDPATLPINEDLLDKTEKIEWNSTKEMETDQSGEMRLADVE
jgi:hypothetical protein